MRLIGVVWLGAGLIACAPPAQQPAQAVNACARSVTHAVTFSDSEHPDTITTRSEGPSCKQAVVTFVLRDRAGDPLWTLANTYYDMTAGGVAPADAPTVTDAQMDTFLAGWANVTMTHSATLPEWKQGAASLSASVQGLSYATSLPHDAYDMLRQRDLALLCFAAAAEATQCMVMDPATGSPTIMVAYGP